MRDDSRDISSIVHRTIPTFERGESLFQEMGGKRGMTTLAEGFYHAMNTLPEAKQIRTLYDEDTHDAQHKLAAFLGVWLAGENHDSAPDLNDVERAVVPEDWSRLAFGMAEKQAWLACMQKALDVQGLDNLLVRYLMVQFSLLAETCRNQP